MDEPCTSRKLFMAAPMAIVVVYRHASLDILSPQVKSAPPQGSCLWLRPQAALWNGLQRWQNNDGHDIHGTDGRCQREQDRSQSRPMDASGMQGVAGGRSGRRLAAG